MNIKVTAKMNWKKGKIEEKTVIITEKELIKKAKTKIKDDIHCGYWWLKSQNQKVIVKF